jgi:hypothetical protein
LHKDIGRLSRNVAEEVGAISATESSVVSADDHSVVARIANEPSVDQGDRTKVVMEEEESAPIKQVVIKASPDDDNTMVFPLMW